MAIFRVGSGQSPAAEIEAAPVIPVGLQPGPLVPFAPDQKPLTHPPGWFSPQVLWSAASAPHGDSLQCTFSGPVPELQTQRLCGGPQQALLRVLTPRKAENHSRRGDRFPLMSFPSAPENSSTDSPGCGGSRRGAAGGWGVGWERLVSGPCAQCTWLSSALGSWPDTQTASRAAVSDRDPPSPGAGCPSVTPIVRTGGLP